MYPKSKEGKTKIKMEDLLLIIISVISPDN